MRVLAFDIGLRNLATVVVTVKPDFSFATLPEFKTYATPDETADQFKQRALLHFLRCGWVIEQWDLVDVSESLDRKVKNVKRLSDITKAIALTDTLQELEDKWFADSAPDVVCVETQHNANAIMRGVGMGVIVFFRRSFPQTVMEGKSGSHKLKICDALGIAEGAGISKRKRASAATQKSAQLLIDAMFESPPVRAPDAKVVDDTEDEETSDTPAPRGGYRGRGRGRGGLRGFTSTGKKREKYEDNKNRAVMAVTKLLPTGHPTLRAHSKKDDLCDVFLMGLWILWSHVAPRAPVKRGAGSTAAAGAGSAPKRRKAAVSADIE